MYVQSVKAGGAAARAGVRANDVIKRVNGRLVTGDNHTDVVNLIQGEQSLEGSTALKKLRSSCFGSPFKMRSLPHHGFGLR